MSCTVVLRIHAPSTKWGETVCLLGDATELGAWKKPIQLASCCFPVWSITCVLPASTRFEYKYVVVSDGTIQRWEQVSANRAFTTQESGTSILVDDGRLDSISRVESGICLRMEDEDGIAECRSFPSSFERASCDDSEMGFDEAVVEALHVELAHSRLYAENAREQIRTIRTIACAPQGGLEREGAEVGDERDHVLDTSRMTSEEMLAAVKVYVDEAAMTIGKIRADLQSMRAG